MFLFSFYCHILLYYIVQIVYTEGPYMQLKVHAEVVDPKTSQHETTNIFHYTFKSQAGDINPVMPKSYSGIHRHTILSTII